MSWIGNFRSPHLRWAWWLGSARPVGGGGGGAPGPPRHLLLPLQGYQHVWMEVHRPVVLDRVDSLRLGIGRAELISIKPDQFGDADLVPTPIHGPRLQQG